MPTHSASESWASRLTSCRALFSPRKAAALERLNRFTPHAGKAYREKRNFETGHGNHVNVSQLSPYIRNGILSEEEVVGAGLKAQTFKEAEKFIQEIFWRVYWKGYLENRPYIWDNYRNDLRSLAEHYSNEPQLKAATHAATGIECFDTWSSELIETGYLHNHARMWFASIWIFTFKLPWQLGADFFLRNLLDGDPASNTLSWRWVAGLHTKGKTYLARPDNIARYTEDRFPNLNGLATHSQAIEEPYPHLPAAPTLLSPAPASLSKGQGLLILDEDLRNHISAFEAGTPVLGLYPESLYNKKNICTRTAAFRKDCLWETLERLTDQYGCNTEFTTHPSAERILLWAREKKVRIIFFAQPQVGHWRDHWQAIAASLEAEGIILTPFRSWWENELFPHATSGFFKFKNHIESVAQRMSPQSHAAS